MVNTSTRKPEKYCTAGKTRFVVMIPRLPALHAPDVQDREDEHDNGDQVGHRGGDRVLEVGKRLQVGLVDEDLGAVRRSSPGHDVEDVEGLELLHRAHDHHDGQRRHQVGQGDVPEPLEDARPVHRCRLVERLVDELKGGKEEDDGERASSSTRRPRSPCSWPGTGRSARRGIGQGCAAG